ncbi:MAG: hypothetical protein JEY99_15050 [Spirochaetales bacterium]|nr:hypothetical protein [Spirochaetales bacterium]
MKRRIIKISGLISIILSFIIFACTNTLLDDISQDIEGATTISAPTLTGVALTNIQTPSWRWSPVPDAEYYRFGFSDNEWLVSGSEDLSFTPLENLTEGTHTLYIQAGKEPDVWSISVAFSIVIDLTPPEAPLVSGETPTNDTTPGWTWNSDTDAQHYRFGYSENSWITENAVITSFMPTSALPEGPHTLLVQAQDAAGNWSSSGSHTITIDLSTPDLTGLASITTPSRSVNWEWDCSDTEAEYRFIVNEVEDPIGDWTLASWGSTQSYLLEDVTGTYYLHIQVRDSLGNISDEEVFSAILDNTLPAVPILSGTAHTNNQTPTWSWSQVTEAQFYRFGFTEGDWIKTLTTDLSYTPDTYLEEGTYTFYLQAGKNADLWSGLATFTTQIDLTPPDDPIVTGTTPTSDTTPEWSWNIDEDASLYRYGLTEGTWITEEATATNYTPISALLEGENTLYVQAQDAAGNWSDSGSFTISIDLTAPDITGLSSNTTPNLSVTWNWDCSDPAAEYRFIVNALEDPINDWTGVSWSSTKTTTLEDVTGIYYLHIQVKDSLENISDETVVSAVLDNTTPVVSGTTETGYSDPTWTWDTPSYTTAFRYQMDEETAGSWIEVSSGTTSYQPFPDDYLNEGIHTLYVQAEDSLGGWSASGSHEIDISIVPPDLTSPTTGSTQLTLMPLLVWEDLDTASYGTGYQVQLNDSNDFTGSVIIDDATLTTNEYQLLENLSPGETYYWRVRVKNNGGFWGETWSTVWNFSIPDTWAMSLGGTGHESANYVSTTSDGGMIVTGYNYTYESNGDLWIVKLNGIGEVEWEKTIGTTSTYNADYGYTILETLDEGFVVAGNGEFSTDFYIHPWIIKLGSSGTIEAEKTYDNYVDEEIYSVQQVVDANGDADGYIACGFTEGHDSVDGWVFKLDSSLVVEWEFSYGEDANGGYDYLRSVRQSFNSSGDPDGYIVAGNSYSFKTGSDYEAWIMKLTSTGTVSWSKCYGYTDSGYDDIFYDVKQTADDGFIATGFSKFGTYVFDHLTAKLDSTGTLEWINNIGGQWAERAYSVLELPTGEFVLGGISDTHTTGDSDAALLKISATGDEILWQKAYGDNTNTGSSDYDVFNSIDTTPSGGYIGGGYTSSYGEGGNDLWLIRVDENGDCGDLDTDTSGTIKAYDDPDDLPEDLNFTETTASVTVTATTAAVSDTASESIETTTSATSAYQEP